MTELFLLELSEHYQENLERLAKTQEVKERYKLWEYKRIKVYQYSSKEIQLLVKTPIIM